MLPAALQDGTVHIPEDVRVFGVRRQRMRRELRLRQHAGLGKGGRAADQRDEGAILGLY